MGWKCPAIKSDDGICFLNPSSIKSVCLRCPICYKKTRKKYRKSLLLDEKPLSFLPEYGSSTAWDEPPTEEIPQCPYYGGDCMVFSGTGAIGEWCLDCANNTPDTIFQKIKRKKPGRKRTETSVKKFEHERYCLSCGNFFWALQDHQKYCSVKCRKREKFKRYFKRKREQKAEQKADQEAKLAKRRATSRG